MAYHTNLFLAEGHAANVVMRIAHVELVVIIAIRILTCAAYGVEDETALDPKLCHANGIHFLSSCRRHR